MAQLDPTIVTARPNLAWASFPCQDVSQAGAGAGLQGSRSGTFWPFWKFIQGIGKQDRTPDLLVIENVCGMITSHGGADLDAICGALSKARYKMGAMVIDASLFLPQSRPRVFLIGVRDGIDVPSHLISRTPKYFHTDQIQRFVSETYSADNTEWIWWNPVPPVIDVEPIAAVLDVKPVGVDWHSHEKTCALLKLMSAHTLLKLGQIRRTKTETVGTVYRRMRPNKQGKKVQRAEVRFDGISGCLRAPTGGSSRQLLLFVNGNSIRSRLLSGREAARLMGLPDSYALPVNHYDAYKISGEGVAVPVVTYLAQNLLEPILRSHYQPKLAANRTKDCRS